jgi:hypothetical protein
MLEIEGKSFMLVIGIMLLLSGAIIFYFRNRMGTLEKAIGKQNQVLSSFIANVQNELRGAGPAPAAAPMETCMPSERCNVGDDKIEVSSDDYDSDDDSDSDSSNTSSEGDAGIRIGEEAPDIKVIEMLKETQEIIDSQEKAIDVTEVLLNNMLQNDNDIDNDSDDDDDIVADVVADIADIADIDDDDDDDDDDDNDEIDSLPVDNITVKKLTNIDLDETIDYNSEKKNVLIQFCKEKGLGDEPTLKRYKKQELVNLLSSV